jgi:hypothetical protein
MRGKLGKKERQAELLHRRKRAQSASGLATGAKTHLMQGISCSGGQAAAWAAWTA